MSDTIQDLIDRQQITHLLHTYCRALDRLDRPMLESIFHSDSRHAMGGFEGPSRDFCGFAMEILASLEGTQHTLGNVTIELDGDIARSECYFIAYHRIAAGVEGPGAFADHDLSKDEDVIMGGRYVDRLERRDGVWKIVHRIGVMDWCRWEDAADRRFFDLGAAPYGRRGKDDPVYTLR